MRFKSLLFPLAVCLSMTLLIDETSAQEKEVLTNSAIIKMVKAKLGEDVVINKIRSSKTNFDISTDGLITLKEAGVSDNIINAMQNPQSELPAAQQTKVASAPSSGDVFIVQGGKSVEMEYVAGFTKILGSSMWVAPFGTPKTRFVIMASGEHAQSQIKDKNPVFLTKLHPSEIGLVKFDADTYNKKPVRYVLRVGDMWQTQGQAAGPAQTNIDFDYKKEPNGLYKITLKTPLEKGEYGFIAPGTGSGTAGPWSPSSSYRIFDFAVVEDKNP